MPLTKSAAERIRDLVGMFAASWGLKGDWGLLGIAGVTHDQIGEARNSFDGADSDSAARSILCCRRWRGRGRWWWRQQRSLCLPIQFAIATGFRQQQGCP